MLCSLCEKLSRVAYKVPGHNFSLCMHCRNRHEFTYGINSQAFEMARMHLLQERHRALKVNSRKNRMEPVKRMPKCPRCRDNEHVEWDHYQLKYVCTHCNNVYSAIGGQFDGSFWYLVHDKFPGEGRVYIYLYGDACVVASSNASELLHSESVLFSTLLNKCEVCREYTLSNDMVVYIDEDGVPNDIIVCPNCVNVLPKNRSSFDDLFEELEILC